MSRRVWIISGSIAVHAGVAVALFAHGVWKIDQLEPGRADVSLAMPIATPPPPAASGAPSNVQVPVSRPKRLTNDLTQQLPKIVLAKPFATPSTGGGGDTAGKGPGGPGGDDGPCRVEPCGPPTTLITEIKIPEPVVEVKIPQPTIIPEHKLNELRISGQTQILPSIEDKRAIHDSGKREIETKFIVCVDPSGTPTPTLKQASRYPAYDAKLLAAIRDWRYRPLMVNGKAIATCAPLRYVYKLQ